MAHKMDAVNRRWLELAAAEAVIEVCPNQTHLIDTEPKPNDPKQQTNPDLGGWGPPTGDIKLEPPSSKMPKSPMKPGFDFDRREWRTTWLMIFEFTLPQIGLPPIVIAPTRVRPNFVEFLQAITPEVKLAIYEHLTRKAADAT